MNLLGTGTIGLQPFAVWSATLQKVSPHINLGYTWNGSSLLAGNPATGESAGLSGPGVLRARAPTWPSTVA